MLCIYFALVHRLLSFPPNAVLTYAVSFHRKFLVDLNMSRYIRSRTVFRFAIVRTDDIHHRQYREQIIYITNCTNINCY